MDEGHDRKAHRPVRAAPPSQRTTAAGPASAAPGSLAEAIADRLVERGLLPAERRAEVTQGLASGTLSADTWRVLAEVTLGAGARGRKP
jgi:hypothetical protein